MGQKVHPESMRVGYIHDWKSTWFSEREFSDYLLEDIKIRTHIETKLAHAGLSDITIRKNKGEVEVNIHTARPGIVIGKSGSEVDALRKELHKMTNKAVKVNILEIKRPELDAKLVAQSIAEQLVNRVAFRRAMKRSLTSAMRSGAKGVKVQVSGRLGGAEMARTEGYSDGRVPLHTIRADIDYGFFEAKTTFGRIGVKVWINKGEIMPKGFAQDLTELEAPQQATQGGGPGGPGGRGGRGGGPGGRGGGPGRPAVAAAVVVAAVRVAPVVVVVVAAVRVVPAAAGAARAGVVADAFPEARQAPQAAPWAHARVLARWHAGRVRRVRAEGHRARLDHQPPDRGSPYRDDPQDQAWRQGLDQHLPGQARDPEAGRDPHGLRQGLARGVGRRGQARPGHVRTVRRAGGPGQGGAPPRQPQASGQDEVRRPRGGRNAVKAVEVHNLDDPQLVDFVENARKDLFNLRFRHATGQLENTANLKTAKKDLARGLTVARARGIDVDAEARKLKKNDG